MIVCSQYCCDMNGRVLEKCNRTVSLRYLVVLWLYIEIRFTIYY